MTGMANQSISAASKGGRVLVVDDNRVNRLLLERQLADAGFEVTSAEGGGQALALLAGDSSEGEAIDFEAVVLDIMMPDIDGMEVLEKIREESEASELPVIMATAKDQSEDIVAALRGGANDYVTKPVDMPVLIARLRVQVGFRRAHAALERMQRSLIDAAKMESLGRLAAGVAHEVKNPLYVLQMGVDYFELITDKENEPAMKTLGRMQNAVDRANSIIRGMVDFSRTEELQLVDCTVNSVIENSLLLVDHEIRDRNIELALELAPDLPELPLDRTKMEQVLINLISNACHAMEKDGHLAVRTRFVRDDELEGLDEGEGHLVAIEVEDDGPGFPDDFNLKLFDPFFTTKPAGQGTGLGLSVTKTIIDLHGGKIDIHNIEPCGAKARVMLGSQPTQDSAPSAVANDHPNTAKADNHHTEGI